jgi:hypothetical protein
MQLYSVICSNDLVENVSLELQVQHGNFLHFFDLKGPFINQMYSGYGK